MKFAEKSDAYVFEHPDKAAHGAYYVGPKEIRFVGANAQAGFFGPDNVVSVGRAVREALVARGIAIPAFAVVIGEGEAVEPEEIDHGAPQPFPRRKPGRPRKLADRVPPPSPE